MHTVLREAAVRRGPPDRVLRRAAQPPPATAAARPHAHSSPPPRPQKGTGAHLFETQPSGNYFEYKSIAIGARCQAAKTYLERFFERKDVDSVATCAFDDMNIDDCVQHALRALGKCVQGDDKLDKDNVSVGVVGKDRPFERLQQEDVAAVLTSIEEDAGPTAGAGAGGMDEEQEEAAESKHA